MNEFWTAAGKWGVGLVAAVVLASKFWNFFAKEWWPEIKKQNEENRKLLAEQAKGFMDALAEERDLSRKRMEAEEKRSEADRKVVREGFEKIVDVLYRKQQ